MIIKELKASCCRLHDVPVGDVVYWRGDPYLVLLHASTAFRRVAEGYSECFNLNTNEYFTVSEGSEVEHCPDAALTLGRAP